MPSSVFHSGGEPSSVSLFADFSAIDSTSPLPCQPPVVTFTPRVSQVVTLAPFCFLAYIIFVQPHWCEFFIKYVPDTILDPRYSYDSLLSTYQNMGTL